MTDRVDIVADLIKRLAAQDKGREVITAIDAIHQGRRDPLRFIPQVK